MDRANDIFDQIDTHQSGGLDKVEISKHLLALGQEQETVMEMFALLNADSDGLISREEFVNGFQKYQEFCKLSAKRNPDGKTIVSGSDDQTIKVKPSGALLSVVAKEEETKQAAASSGGKVSADPPPRSEPFRREPGDDAERQRRRRRAEREAEWLKLWSPREAKAKAEAAKAAEEAKAELVPESVLKLLPPPAAPPADEAELQAAVEAAKTAEPLPPVGQFPETWDDGETWQWSAEKDKATNKLPRHSARVQREMASFQAIVDLDQARIAVHDRPKCPSSYRAVRVGWLRQLAVLLPLEWTTAQVVERAIKPATATRHCRFVELMAEGDVGEAGLFVSHTWNAPFVDLVAAICHVATDDMFVWLDVFSVRQWPGNRADLDFRPVVKEAHAFLLCARHVQEVAAMSQLDAVLGAAFGKVPAVAFSTCAFFRVWCVVELAAAAAFKKNVIMLVGQASKEDLAFEPNADMLHNLNWLVDVRKAVASVPKDKTDQLAKVEAQEGGADGVNSKCKGSIAGAMTCMDLPAVLAAAVGHMEPLRALVTKEKREEAMHAAAAGGFKEAVVQLLEDGVEVDAKMEDGNTALTRAVFGGHLPVVQALLEKGADPEAIEEGGGTALMSAAVQGHLPVVQALLEKGAKVDAKDDMIGMTALLFAAGAGHLPVVQALLEKGAEVDAKQDKTGGTALLAAAGAGHLLVVLALIEKGADVNAKHKAMTAAEFAELMDGTKMEIKAGHNALMSAALIGHLPIVQVLLENGADVQAKTVDGQTALIMAAQNGHLPVVHALLEKGADMQAKNILGFTALMQAANAGQSRVVVALLEKGADVEALKDRLARRTALMQAAADGHLPVVQALIEKGVEVEATDKNGDTVLIFAAAGGHLPVVQALIEKGAGVQAKNEFGLTALMFAAFGGHLPVVQALIEKGAGVQAKDNDGVTALMFAARHGHLQVLQALLEKGADVQAKNEFGVTALMAAAAGGHLPVVQALLQKGAADYAGSPGLVQALAGKSNGKTAADYAKHGGHAEIERLLRARPPPVRAVLNKDRCDALDDTGSYIFDPPREQVATYEALRQEEQPDRRTLPMALLERAKADIPRIEQLERDHPRMARLFNKGLLPFGVWEQLLDAEARMDTEVMTVQAEAESLQWGWGKGVFGQAYQMLRKDREAKE